MPAFRVVLYAEGGGETAGIPSPHEKQSVKFQLRRVPGEALTEDKLGTGHVLLRRALETAKHLSPDAICFKEGLRVRGKIPRGSQLLIRDVLRQLLTWLDPGKRPDLVVVLVDRDGDKKRGKLLSAHLVDLQTAPWIIGVAREEFEAWLIADETAVAKVLGQHVDRTPKPESLPPGEAKRIFNDWIAANVPKDQQIGVRREVAGLLDLDVLKERCPAFNTFLRDLAQIDIQRV